MIKIRMRIEKRFSFLSIVMWTFLPRIVENVRKRKLKMGLAKNSRFHRLVAAVAALAVAEIGLCCRHTRHKRSDE
jgi:hypothetical protein